MKKILFAICCMACALALSECSSDDDNGNDPGLGKDPENSTDYIATKDVKNITMPTEAGSILIYEDYARRYILSFDPPTIRLLPYKRIYADYTNEKIENREVGIYKFDNVANLKNLNDEDKAEAKQNCHNYYNGELPNDRRRFTYTNFSPNCGFITWFTTETSEELFVRIRTTGYTLDSKGSLESVSIEYQLF